MSTRTRLLLIAAIQVAAFVIYVAALGLSVWTALGITVVTFALTSLSNGWPRMPRRRDTT